MENMLFKNNSLDLERTNENNKNGIFKFLYSLNIEMTDIKFKDNFSPRIGSNLF